MCTYDRNDSKRPAISEPKQILDVISFVRHIMQTIYVFVYEKINQNSLNRLNIRNAKYPFILFRIFSGAVISGNAVECQTADTLDNALLIS